MTEGQPCVNLGMGVCCQSDFGIGGAIPTRGWYISLGYAGEGILQKKRMGLIDCLQSLNGIRRVTKGFVAILIGCNNGKGGFHSFRSPFPWAFSAL